MCTIPYKRQQTEYKILPEATTDIKTFKRKKDKYHPNTTNIITYHIPTTTTQARIACVCIYLLDPSYQLFHCYHFITHILLTIALFLLSIMCVHRITNDNPCITRHF